MEDKKQIKEINASSMADIAFLLLIFFLVATTMNVDTGITRQLPPLPPENQKVEDIIIKERNVLQVYVTQYDQIYVSEQQRDISQLKNIVKEFILNRTNDENMPEREDRQIAMPDGSTWTYPVSKGLVSLTSARGTSYDIYIQVQNELTRASNEMRNDVARLKFNRDFIALDDNEREAVQDAVPPFVSEAGLRNAGGN